MTVIDKRMLVDSVTIKKLTGETDVKFPVGDS